MSLQCPKCDKPLRNAIYEGVKVAYCESCKGFLMTGKGLRRIEQTHEIEIPRDAAPPQSRGPEAGRTCPRCKVSMKKEKYGKLSTTIIDVCEKCKAQWLDQGELERIQLDYEMVQENIARSQGKAAARTKRFKCPACGHAQDEGVECVSCGIVFAKYVARQREESAREERETANVARMEETFSKVRGFDVKQAHHLTEALIGFERANRFALSPQPASATRGMWHIEETNTSGLSFLGRNLFGALYTFTMDFYDEDRSKILHVERRPKLYFHAIDIFDENGRKMGRARRRFSFFNRVVSVENDRGKELLRIVGPVYRPWTFHLRHLGKNSGSIVKKWSGVLKEAYTDADNFQIRFKGSLDPKRKRLTLAAMMLIDSLYFEGDRKFSEHFFSAPGVQAVVGAAILAIFIFARGHGAGG